MKANQLARAARADSAVLIRAETLKGEAIALLMNPVESEAPVAEIPLPESQRDIALLLEALHALNAALDQCESEETVKTT